MTPVDEPVTIRVVRLPHAEGIDLPRYATAGAAGMDVRAAVTADLEIAPGAVALVPTGLVLEVPRGFEVQVRPRSGLALTHRVTLPNSPGTVDADYRGELSIIVANHGDGPFVIRRGDRVAQLVLARVWTAEMVVVDALGESNRGAGGFGHTGTA